MQCCMYKYGYPNGKDNIFTIGVTILSVLYWSLATIIPSPFSIPPKMEGSIHECGTPKGHFLGSSHTQWILTDKRFFCLARVSSPHSIRPHHQTIKTYLVAWLIGTPVPVCPRPTVTPFPPTFFLPPNHAIFLSVQPPHFPQCGPASLVTLISSSCS